MSIAATTAGLSGFLCIAGTCIGVQDNSPAGSRGEPVSLVQSQYRAPSIVAAKSIFLGLHFGAAANENCQWPSGPLQATGVPLTSPTSVGPVRPAGARLGRGWVIPMAGGRPLRASASVGLIA